MFNEYVYRFIQLFIISSFNESSTDQVVFYSFRAGGGANMQLHYSAILSVIRYVYWCLLFSISGAFVVSVNTNIMKVMCSCTQPGNQGCHDHAIYVGLQRISPVKVPVVSVYVTNEANLTTTHFFLNCGSPASVFQISVRIVPCLLRCFISET